MEFRPLKITFDFDLERFIDDFIFLCFFVGNDFIPNLPSLKIREGAIDALLFIYKNEIINLDNYITEGNGNINLKRAEKILDKLGIVEESFLRTSTNNRIYYENRNREIAKSGAIVNNNRDKKDILYEKFKQLKDKNKSDMGLQMENSNKNQKSKLENNLQKDQTFLHKNKDEISLDLLQDELQLTSDSKKKVNENTQFQSDAAKVDNVLDTEDKIKFNEDDADNILKLQEKPEESFKRIFKEYQKETENEKTSKYVDKVRLGETGYKDRYYLEKFKTPYSNKEFRELIKKAYIEGICWVFNYYYNGCVSWGWYYPFHYAPFASDLNGIADLNIKFDMGEPYEPVEQLLSVLPPYSSKALPSTLRDLMHNKDSEIADFFPKDILLDINGHPFSWMGVNLIPFIDEERIRIVVQNKKPKFSKEETERNKFGSPLVFFNNKENECIRLLIGENYKNENYIKNLNTPNFRTFSGILSFYDDSINIDKNYECNLKGLNIRIVKDCKIGAMIFQNADSIPHFSHLLKGVTIPQKIVLEDNLDFYNKRGFRGEQTIKLVNSILRYQNEIENEFKNNLFDRKHFNNNRAIEYNPADLEMMRKKRYRERESVSSNFGVVENNTNQTYQNNNNRRYYNNYDMKEPNKEFKPSRSYPKDQRLNYTDNNLNNMNTTRNNFGFNKNENLMDLSSNNHMNRNFTVNSDLRMYNQNPYPNYIINNQNFIVNNINPLNLNYETRYNNTHSNQNMNIPQNPNIVIGTNQINPNIGNTNNDILNQFQIYKGKNQ